MQHHCSNSQLVYPIVLCSPGQERKQLLGYNLGQERKHYFRL